MADLLQWSLSLAVCCIAIAGGFRFFSWTRKPWLAATLAGMSMFLVRVYNYSDGLDELVGPFSPLFVRDLFSGAVLAGVFYEWRDRSGRAYAGYAALSRWGRFATAILAVGVSGFFGYALWCNFTNH